MHAHNPANRSAASPPASPQPTPLSLKYATQQTPLSKVTHKYRTVLGSRRDSNPRLPLHKDAQTAEPPGPRRLPGHQRLAQALCCRDYSMALKLLCGVEDLLASGSQLVWSMAEEVLRRCYAEGWEPCRRFFYTWLQLGEVLQMTQGRQCQVLLLDGRQLELLVQPKLLSRDLLDLVSSHFNLKEKEYFGISFFSETGQNNWLHLDRRVLDHDLPKKSGPLELKFCVRYYIENISFLKDTTTVELFFLNAKSAVFDEDIEVESAKVFRLAAYAVQEAKGDYTSDDTTRSDLKKLPVLPTAVLKEHPSLAYCEDRVIEHYKQLKGISRGEAIVRYLKLVESLPTYGVHYFEVKDKQGIPWWLGISYRGIGQFDLQDKLKPRKLFRWRQLENLYFREKKFAVEVNDPHRRVVPKRALGQSGLVIHTWYASHSLIKSIWGMAISQHQFYLDRKQSKAKITTTKSLGDIAMDLTEVAVPRISKLPSLAAKDQLIMASNGSLVSADSLESEGSEEQKKEKIAELKKKEKGLQDLLTQKLEELKKICLREAELTGKLPKDYPLAAGEKAPNVRRRMGTAFKLDDLFPYNEDPFLRNLESRFALQQKIVEAAQKLAGEMELGKTVKKKRRRNLMDAMKRLQEIEDEINAYRMKTGLRPTQRASLIIPDDVNPADLSSLSDSLTQEDDEAVVPQRQRSRSVQYSAFPGTSDDLEVPYPDRRASTMEQYLDSNRLNHAEIQDHYVRREAVSSHGTPHRAPSRQPRDARSMPPTPTLTRNAYSSIQLRSDDGPQLFRQRSGSLESQTPLAPEMDVPEPVFTITPARRSNSTELLDDGSSYTSQSSMEYCAPAGNHGNHASRYRYRRNRKGNMYANTGSMPNLAQNDPQHPRQRPTTTAYYVTGYPRYAEPEPHAAYVYESDMEGLYSVNPSYSAYQGQEAGGGYGGGGGDEVDGIAHNPYATLRPPRNRPPSRNEQPLRNFQKALVAEHLRGWYNRNAPQKQTGYDYERGSQHSLGYQTMPAHYGHNNRTYSTASSSSNAGNWRGHLATGLSEYDLPHYQDYQDYQYHHHHHQQQHPPHQHHHQHQYQQHYQYQHQHQLSPCHYSYGSMPTHSRPPLSDRRSSAQHSARTPSHLPALPSARTSSSSSYHSSYRSSSSSSLPLPSWWPVGNAGSSPQWPRGSRCEAASGNRAVTGPLLGVARDSRTWT